MTCGASATWLPTTVAGEPAEAGLVCVTVVGLSLRGAFAAFFFAGRTTLGPLLTGSAGAGAPLGDGAVVVVCVELLSSVASCATEPFAGAAGCAVPSSVAV